MTIISGFIVTSLCFTLFYLFGLFVFITDHEENKCEMTYMFQYPQFVQISMKTHSNYRKYALYAYSEGRFTENARDMKFEGIPVLFVPGNAGSYKQVRSLASVALRKALTDRPGFHFDYFTVDLNEELSGINGALLNDQMRYVNRSIDRILELYKDTSRPPKSVVLIGHSMGGIILRALLSTLPQTPPLVITLATPHNRPPVVFDMYMSDFYKKIQTAPILNNTVLVSIAGGYNDFLVPSYLSNMNNKHNQSLYTVSTNIPRVWLPTDHLCILWCKQLVLTINRALFDSVDLRTRQLSVDPKRHQLVFHHHLIHNSGTKINLAHRYNEPIASLDNRGEWFESLYRQYSVELSGPVRQTQWYMIRYADFPQHETVTVLALNMEAEDWVFACPAIYVRGHSRICNDGVHLTHRSTMAPSLLYKRRVIDVNMHELKKNYSKVTHVVARVLPNDDPVVLHIDVYNSQQRTRNVSLPHILSFRKQIVIPQTDAKAIRYDLVFPELQHIIQSYKLYVEPISCTRVHHHATASLSAPWANEGSHTYITEEIKEPLHLRLHSSQQRGNNQSVTVKLILDPSCLYQISIRSSLSGSLGQLARFYSSLLIANVAVVVFMGFRHQLKTIGRERSCNLFLTAINQSAKPFYILPVVKLISLFLSWEPLNKTFPNPDWNVIINEGLDFLLLPLVLYICSVGIVWILALALSSAIILAESTIQRIALMFLARSFTGTIAFSDYLMSGLHKLPIVVAGSLIALCFCTCGGLALCVGAIFYFLKLTHMSQEFVEQWIWNVVKKYAFQIRRYFKNRKSKRNETSTETQGTPVENVQTGGNTHGESEHNTEKEETHENSGEKKTENNTKSATEKEQNSSKTDKSKESKVSISWDTAIFFHFTVFLLWTLVAGLCIPSVLTWAHNFRYSTSLSPDPSFWPGVILCICAVPLWQLELPNFKKKWYGIIGEVMYILAIASVMFSVISLYRLTYLLTISIVIVTLHQLFAPSEDGATEENTSDVYAEKVKAKWE